MRALPIVAVILGLTGSFAKAQQIAPQQFPVLPAAVADTVTAALAERGIHISADQVRLPIAVSASKESPSLQAGAIEKLGHLSDSQPGQRSASVKVKCTPATACRPFFAIATWNQDQEDKVTQQATAASTPSTSATKSLTKSKNEQPAVRAEQPATIIKAGQPLILLLDAEQMHIRISVVSTANASVGQTVRVATPDHKHFYMAEVLDSNTVKGTV